MRAILSSLRKSCRQLSFVLSSCTKTLTNSLIYYNLGAYGWVAGDEGIVGEVKSWSTWSQTTWKVRNQVVWLRTWKMWDTSVVIFRLLFLWREGWVIFLITYYITVFPPSAANGGVFGWIRFEPHRPDQWVKSSLWRPCTRWLRRKSL